MFRLPQIFWTVATLDALLFVVALVMMASQSTHSDGGKEMALFFFVFVPSLVLIVASLTFHYSHSLIVRLLALFIVTVPALLYAKYQVEDYLVDRSIASHRSGVGWFSSDAMRAMGAAVVNRDVPTLMRVGPSVDVNTVGDRGMTLLALAVDADGLSAPGHMQVDEMAVVRALLSLGAKPEQGLDGALRRASPEVLEVLLNAGANPNMLADNGQPLVFKWKSGLRPEMLQALISHGLDLNSRWYEDPMPVVFTIFERWDLLAILIEKGADMTRPRPDGRNVAGELARQIAEEVGAGREVPPDLLRAKALLDASRQAPRP